MKRSKKNIITAILIILLCGLIFATMIYAKKQTTNNRPDKSTMQQGEFTPPSQSNGSSEATQPPELPNGETNKDSSSDSSQASEPPSNNSNSNSKQGDNQIQPGQGNPPSDMKNFKGGRSLSITYYIIFGIESFLLALLLVYWVFSKFHKKNFKETIGNGKQIALQLLVVVLLTGGITFATTKITAKTFRTNKMNFQNGQGGPGNATASIDYSAAKEITSSTTLDNGTYDSTTANENALLATGDIDVTLSNLDVTKSGSANSGDNSSFYGNNSAILAKDGTNLTLKGLTVTTKDEGTNGVFSYGGSATTSNSKSDGTTVTISDSKITTTGDNAGGIMTTGGGTTNASNLDINTAGTSSAAIRTDRGGGTVNVDGGTYTTTGKGSPSIYSTANVTAKNATLTAKASEGIVIEGKNSVTLDQCTLDDNNAELNGQSTTYKNIFLYQSMSGDADDGTSSFNATDSTITTKKGDTLYVTNTKATINLTNNTIKNTDSSGNFLRVQKDSWGNSGSNGGQVTLEMSNQKSTGNIVVDDISTLDLTMKSNSSYEGTINGDNKAKSITLKLDKSSKIKLTKDCYVTSLEDADSSYSNIDFNGYKLYVNGTAIQ